jgi:hypothetical protein
MEINDTKTRRSSTSLTALTPPSLIKIGKPTPITGCPRTGSFFNHRSIQRELYVAAASTLSGTTSHRKSPLGIFWPAIIGSFSADGEGMADWPHASISGCGFFRLNQFYHNPLTGIVHNTIP